MSTTTSQGALAIFESDILTSLSGPIGTFLANIKANTSLINEAAQWVQLQGALLGALPNLEVQIQQQLITALQAKLATLTSGPPTAVPAPAAVSA
jgi:hypothetical protein